MDATLIAASPSTKNKAQKRDPEMRQSKKGNNWYFGMKVHTGVCATSGLVHTAGVTTGKVHDAKVFANLIREDDRAVYGDKAYASEKKKRLARRAGVLWAVKEKAKRGQKLSDWHRARNKRFGRVRAKVEHVFRVVKCQFGYRKVHYRDIKTNGAQVFALLALANSTSPDGRVWRREGGLGAVLSGVVLTISQPACRRPCLSQLIRGSLYHQPVSKPTCSAPPPPL